MVAKRMKKWGSRKKRVPKYERKKCSKCGRELYMKKARSPKCPYCKGAWFTKPKTHMLPSVTEPQQEVIVPKNTLGDIINDALKAEK